MTLVSSFYDINTYSACDDVTPITFQMICAITNVMHDN